MLPASLLTLKDSFTEFLKRKKGREPLYLTSLREDAFRRFMEKGLPKKTEESYRFNQLSWMNDFLPLPTFRERPSSYPPVTFLPESRGKLFVDSVFLPPLYGSSPTSSEENFLYIPWEEMGSDTLQELGEILPELCKSENPILNLTLAFLEGGGVLKVPPSTTLSSPIEVIQIQKEEGNFFPFHFLWLEKGSKVSWIERFRSVEEESHKVFPVTVAYLKEGAELHYFRVQEEGKNTYHWGIQIFFLEESSTLKGFTTHWGGKFAREEIQVEFRGVKGTAELFGIYLAREEQEHDFHTQILHKREECTSNQLFKGVLLDRSHGVFDGSIYVAPGAQKTNALQTNKNLILSPSAWVNTNPHLEIYADDVRCTHGATVGQLHPEELFYLRSRGIPAKEGEKILTFGFLNDILTSVPIASLRGEWEQYIFQKLLSEEDHS